jgi:predicted esterase
MNVKQVIFILAIFLLPFEAESQEAVRYNDFVFDNYTFDGSVRYGSNITQAGEKERLTMDIYQPKGDDAATRPLVILAHGGFFLFGDKSGFTEECIYLAKSGYVVVSINYRLIDVENSDTISKRAVIDAVHDMKAAVRFFYKDASKDNLYKIDTNNIFIGGYSAGAITSLHYAYAGEAKDVMEMGGKDLLDYQGKHNGVEGNSGNEGYSSNVRGVINIAGSLHSATLVEANEPVLFSVHGTLDEIVPYETGITGETTVETEGSKLIHEQAKKIGLVNELMTVEGGDHFSFMGCDECRDNMRAFIFANLQL